MSRLDLAPYILKIEKRNGGTVVIGRRQLETLVMEVVDLRRTLDQYAEKASQSGRLILQQEFERQAGLIADLREDIAAIRAEQKARVEREQQAAVAPNHQDPAPQVVVSYRGCPFQKRPDDQQPDRAP